MQGSTHIQSWSEESRRPPGDGGAADPDVSILSDADLRKAAEEGKKRG